MKRILCAVLALIILLTVSSCKLYTPKQYAQGEADAKLIVHFIDVGQGDSILLESDDEFVLIDAGERSYGDTVSSYINERGADELKYVIATHPHTDHMGGMRTVLNDIAAENFITTETDCATNTWIKLLKTVEEKKINYIDAKSGDTYTFGSASFTILAPNSDSYDGYNNYSVVTKVTCGDISFMLTGDAEKESEYEMVNSGADLHADVLKCGHHGSSTSTTAKFLKAVDPSYAVISCGKDNDYGHPHKETMQKLNTLGTTILRTDQMGTIVAYTDGKGLSFSAANNNLPTELNKAEHEAATAKAAEPQEASYIGNKNSHVFHTPDCGGVKNMNEKNKVTFENREEAVEAGYHPCSSCNP